MKARRERLRQIRAAHVPRRETKLLVKPASPCFQEKPLRRGAGARTKTDTGRRVEHTKAIGRTMVKELGIPTP